MAMWIEVCMSDGSCIHVQAAGGYAPDVMHDLQNRAAALMSHAAGISLQVMRVVHSEGLAGEDVADEEQELSE